MVFFIILLNYMTLNRLLNIITFPTIIILTCSLFFCEDSATSALIEDPYVDDENGNALNGDYPAQPEPGTLFWGASMQLSIHDPETRHEEPAGAPLSLHRSFFRWDQRIGNMITRAENDLSNNRLPWVSIKPPNQGEDRWQRIANGEFDDELDDMLMALDALNGPVWFTMHHEPENEHQNSPGTYGQAPEHRAMNKHIRERMIALDNDNIAFALNLMSWTFDIKSERNPDNWWEEDIYDIMSVNMYAREEGESVLTWGEAITGGPRWPMIRLWAEERGVDLAVGEWGMRGSGETAAQNVFEWYEHAANSHEDGKGARVVGLSAFDSGQNSPGGSWELQGSQLEMFHQLMGDPRTANIEDFQ